MILFTPTTALIGGVCLGVAAIGKLLVTGRILGISGALKGFVVGDVTTWRLAFAGGMALGAVGAAKLLPDGAAVFDTLPDTFTVTRAALGGLLVGLGAALGNGCTSGHGICGNARLSLRSAVYTMIFMASGMSVATLTQSAAAAGIAPKAASLTWPSSNVLSSGLLLVVGALVTMCGLASCARQVKQHQVLGLVAEVASGVLFAFGLVYTGMVRPTKVIAFLSPTHPAWDLSLACVMGGALLVALPGFQAILNRASKPCCESRFQLPAVHSIDAKLVVGGVLFGAGWGLSGMCPGPAVVAAVAKPVPQVLAYVAAMMAGMMIEGGLAKLGSEKADAATVKSE